MFDFKIRAKNKNAKKGAKMHFRFENSCKKKGKNAFLSSKFIQKLKKRKLFLPFIFKKSTKKGKK